VSRPAVFVDTSAFYALADARDAAHRAVLRQWEALSGERRPLVTTVAVAAETASLIRRWLGFASAQRWLDQLDRARLVRALELVFVGEREYALAREFFRKLGDPRLSFVDALSFAVMTVRGITACLTLDEDYRQAGFEVYG
jgi:predicted nucleic acid-binding protein